MPHVALRVKPFVKVGARPVPCGSGPTVWARPLGDGVGSGDLRDGSPSVWSKGKALVWGLVPPISAICKSGSTCLVPYRVGATVNDILMVNPAGVIGVFSLYTRSTSRLELDLLL